MTEPTRPNPDALLANIQNAEQSAKRGKLKVFFGMCPGVGKTYAMLQAAQQQKRAGVDVIVGLVETHGRIETEALLADLEILPRREWPHRGITLQEFDIDAALTRRPPLILVDELAHTNAPGSRHPKRFQDVLELLDAGISVYTTVNIQHLESRVDVVRQITGVRVTETVPDSVLDQASDIQLIDLPPDQLRKRIEEGRVYLGEAAGSAATNFFREGNLIALREMALRYTAERVDQQVRDFMREQRIGGPWKSSERLLVGVGPSPFSENLVRWARRTATAQDATWLAVYVETGVQRTAAETQRVTQNLSLARQLGAEVLTISAPDVGAALLRVAREHNVSQIVVGKPKHSLIWRVLRGGDMVDYLLRHSGEIDLYIVRPDSNAVGEPVRRQFVPVRTTAREFIMAGLVVLGATLVGFVVRPLAGYTSVALFYLCGIVGASLFLGRWPVLLAAGASAVLWNLLFIPPLFTLNIHSFHDTMMFFSLLVVGVVLGHLTSRLHQREEAERERQRRSTALLQLTEHCTLESTLDKGLTSALHQIDSLFGLKTALYLRNPQRQLSATPHVASAWTPGEKDQAVAQWAFGHRQAAGSGTNTLPQAGGLFLPLQTRTSIMGVLGVQMEGHATLTLPERELLDAFAAQIGLALEKEHFREAFQRADLIEQSDKLRRTLLNNVSHELKTPVAAIRTALATMKAQAPVPQASTMLNEVEEASARLERVVSLLVDSARLETGMVQPRPEWCHVQDVIATAMESSSQSLARHHVSIEAPEGLPLVKVDPLLCAQALSHLLTNAGMHTPAGTAVTINAAVTENSLILSVLDSGPGLRETVRIFDKFHRGESTRAGGLGLGLSISRGLAHGLGGEVSAANREGGGAVFTLRVPVEVTQEAPV